MFLRSIRLSGILVAGCLTTVVQAVLVLAHEPVYWQGLVVEPENRCSPYDDAEYADTKNLELQAVSRQGFLGDPYTGQRLESLKQSEIEHIVSRAEAHDSGLCAAGADEKKAFARDLLNITTAEPKVNQRKSNHDLAGW